MQEQEGWLEVSRHWTRNDVLQGRFWAGLALANIDTSNLAGNGRTAQAIVLQALTAHSFTRQASLGRG